jgi:hypothetical protein
MNSLFLLIAIFALVLADEKSAEVEGSGAISNSESSSILPDQKKMHEPMPEAEMTKKR